MSESSTKKNKKILKKMYKKQIQETAEKFVTKRIQDRENKLKKDMFYIARQRDIMFLLNIALSISTIVFFTLFIIEKFFG